jgi:hypothetical protein
MISSPIKGEEIPKFYVSPFPGGRELKGGGNSTHKGEVIASSFLIHPHLNPLPSRERKLGSQ